MAMAMAMATATETAVHHHHQQLPRHFGVSQFGNRRVQYRRPSSSTSSASTPTTSSHDSYTKCTPAETYETETSCQFRTSTHRNRDETIETSKLDTCDKESYTTLYNFATSQGRRGFGLMTAISIILPLHWSAEMVAADELSIVRSGVRNYLSKTKAAGVLRMAFHDAGTFDIDDSSGGMNGSIAYELDRPENAGLTKPLKVLEKAKREIDKSQQVSWADLIAVAGAEAVSLCGGPTIPIRLGRLDASMPDPQGRLPEESFDASGLKRCFLKKGFSTQELVALSGAHTLGGKGFGSPVVFDNAYFKILLEKPWTSPGGMSSMIGLPSDHALVEDDECLRWIKLYAADQEQFFNDFRSAYIKLVDSGAEWRSA